MTLVAIYPIYCRKRVKGHLDKPLLSMAGSEEAEALLLFPRVPFARAVTSINLPATRLLMCTRLASAAVFLGLGVTVNAQLNDGNFDIKFFTNWNVLLVSMYYVLASAASISEARSPSATVADEEQRSSQFAVVLHVLFEVAGSTAFLITVVNFLFLDQDVRDLENTVCHLATSCSFIIEAILNSFAITRAHFIFLILWYLFYISVIWTCVAFSAVQNWPYDFLDTSTPYCFAWYTGLLVAASFFYYLFYVLNMLKTGLHDCIRKRQQLREQEDGEKRQLRFLDDALGISRKAELA